MNWHQMIPAWFRRAAGGKIPSPTETESVPALLSPGRQLPTVVVVSPIYRHASLYVQWAREQPETDPLTVFRILTTPDRLRGMNGDGKAFVWIEGGPESSDLFEALTRTARTSDGKACVIQCELLDDLYKVRRDG